MTSNTTTDAPSTTKRPKPTNPYAQQYQTFREFTEKHELTVESDNGLDRRLRMRDPGAGYMWSWGIVTWPGHLATFGDIGAGYVFSRVDDMLQFFGVPESLRNYYSDGSPCIDFRYWAEKLCGPDAYQRVREFSQDKFLRDVRDGLAEDPDLGTEAQAEYEKIVAVAKRVCSRHGVGFDAYVTDLRQHDGRSSFDLDVDDNDSDEVEYFGLPIPLLSPAQRRHDLFTDARDLPGSSDLAYEWLDEHHHVFGSDTCEWDFQDFDSHFIYTCYALELTTRRWREAQAASRHDFGTTQ